MPRHAALLLSLVLGAALHVDWHLARPLHHRLSLAWPLHWLATAAVFAIAGCMIARLWPGHRWPLGAIVFVGAAVLAQAVEPVLEVLIYEQRLGYDGEPARWMAFWKAIAAGGFALGSSIWLCAPRPAARAS